MKTSDSRRGRPIIFDDGCRATCRAESLIFGLVCSAAAANPVIYMTVRVEWKTSERCRDSGRPGITPVGRHVLRAAELMPIDRGELVARVNDIYARVTPVCCIQPRAWLLRSLRVHGPCRTVGRSDGG